MPENISVNLRHTLKDWTNNGYPFAELVLSRYENSNDTIRITYHVVPGESVTIDTVVFGDFSPAEVRRLKRLIRDDLAGLYHADRIHRVQNRLNGSNWLKTTDRHDISGNALRFYVEKVEDFTVDALLSYQSKAGGLVGQADIAFVNFLGLGRRADFSWYHPSERTNRVSANWMEPYLFNTGFSAKLRFKQEHEDTLYVTRESRFELVWQNRNTDMGIMVSQEDVYTTDAGEAAGIVSGTRHVSALSFQVSDRIRDTWQYELSVAGGIRTGEDTLQYPLEYECLITHIRGSLYFQGKTLGGRIFSQGTPADYQRFRLGGGTFLRGALFEQYRTDWFAGGILEGGVDDGVLRAGIFTDWAFLQGVNDPLFHVGVSLSLPAGASRMKILLGFDLREPLSQGKIHVGWTF